MPRLPSMTPAKVIRILERAGFLFIRQRGSHRIYMKGDRIVTIPFHGKDLRIGTLKHIIKQSGLTLDEFLSFH